MTKRSPVFFALIGVCLLVIGAVLTYLSTRAYSEQRVVANAGACKLEMSVIQLAGLPENSQGGSVILFHGLSANKVIMTNLARAFALQGLRVYVPDLPGHGRSSRSLYSGRGGILRSIVCAWFGGTRLHTAGSYDTRGAFDGRSYCSSGRSESAGSRSRCHFTGPYAL